MAEKVGADPEFNDEELGIVDSIESQFLDEIMTWKKLSRRVVFKSRSR